MPVTARRMPLQRGVSPISSEPSIRPTGRSLARHRKTKPAATPRAAAAMTLSVGLAVGGGAAISVVGTPQTADAATTPAGAARGAQPIKTKPALRYGDSGTAVKYVQYRLRVPMSSWYGAATRNAVSNFQRAINLPRTGTMNQRTWNSLFYIAKHPTKKKQVRVVTGHQLPHPRPAPGGQAGRYAVPVGRHDSEWVRLLGLHRLCVQEGRQDAAPDLPLAVLRDQAPVAQFREAG